MNKLLLPQDIVGGSFWLISVAMIGAAIFFFLERGRLSNRWATVMNLVGVIALMSSIHVLPGLVSLPPLRRQAIPSQRDYLRVSQVRGTARSMPRHGADQGQLGLSYKELEEAMNNKNSKNREKYIKMRKANLHKMEPIPVCKIPN